MKPVTDMEYFKPQEDIVNVLVSKTQNENKLFFRILTAYHLTKMASMMRCKINATGIGIIPVNFYGVNLSPSGSGKGFSTNIIETKVVNLFKDRFINETMPYIAVQNMSKLAIKEAAIRNTTESEELQKLEREYEETGNYPYSFDSGTSPAVKQLRHMLLLAGIGSINFEVDEIGSNFVNNTDVLNLYLELFDTGIGVKQKLTKNTAENRRNREIHGATPANMMLYGTPGKLLNGSKTEDEFYTMLDTGYARRCFFGYSRVVNKPTDLTAEQVYDMLTDTSSNNLIDNLSNQFEALADTANYDMEITVSKDIMLQLLHYRLECERAAEELKDFEEIQKAEMSHRYYKVLKLAGTYAFIECNSEITQENLEAAIKLAEESGASFQHILNRPKIPERIARYLADQRKEVTQVDMMEDLSFYRGGASHRRDLITQAIAWGYRNNIIIKTSIAENIEFFKGETLQETNLNEMIVSYSGDITVGYEPEKAPFDMLHQLVCADGYHYAAHHFHEGYRDAEHAIPGFNMIMLDVDDGLTIDAARELLKEYTALFATTKRHTDSAHRFRIILPMSHVIELNPENYKRFMKNVLEWLPFDTDEQTVNISRKWESFNGDYYYQEGDLVDALKFIPDTRKQHEQHQKILDNASLSNLERWFLLNSDVGSRSNTLIKYALMLVDAGHSYDSIKAAVIAFNDKLKSPLPMDELEKTILLTTMRKITAKNAA